MGSTEATGSRWRHCWDIEGTVDYICARSASRVALQIPDELLHQASLLSDAVQQACSSRSRHTEVFVMADTSYNSEGVDEVAAQHARADCVIHYGRASLSPVSTLPTYFVFGRQQLDTSACAKRIADYCSSSANLEGVPAVLVVPDQPYSHAAAALQAELQARLSQACCQLPVSVAHIVSNVLEPDVLPSTCSSTAAGSCNGSSCQQQCSGIPQPAAVTQSASDALPGHALHAGRDLGSTLEAAPSEMGGQQAAQDACMPAELTEQASASSQQQQQQQQQQQHSMGPYRWHLPCGTLPQDCVWVWVGPDDSPVLTQLQMWRNDSHWVMWDPCEDRWQEGIPLEIIRTLKRRYYLVEKARNAHIVGILVGTLGVAGHRGVVQTVRAAAKGAGKKTYTILMGKPSPYKLANFPEIEVFVMIADPQLCITPTRINIAKLAAAVQGQILDSKEYLAPLITPQEALIAFSSDRQWSQAEWSTDFASILREPDAGDSLAHEQPRFSLLDGGLHAEASARLNEAAEKDAQQPYGQLLVRPDTKISSIAEPGSLAEVRVAADYFLARRGYRGLEAPATGAQPKAASLAVAGRSGRAAGYEQEPFSHAS